MAAERAGGEDRQADPRRLRSARTGRSLLRIAEDESGDRSEGGGRR